MKWFIIIYSTCTGRFFLDETNDWNGRYAAEPTTGQLNPVLDETYELVNKVISEIASMFPDGSFHGGGDEPIYKCWEDEPSVREYMNAHNATGEDLLNKFLTNEIQFIQKAGKQPILWEGKWSREAVLRKSHRISLNISMQTLSPTTIWQFQRM